MSTTVVSDSFTRTSSTSLGTADTGQTWISAMGTWGTNGTQALLEAALGENSAVVDSGQSDCTVSVNIYTPTQSNSPRLVWRSSNSSNQFITDLGNGKYLAYRYQSGSYTQVASSTLAPKTGDLVQVVLSGSTHTVSVNGTQIMQFTDTFNQTATKHGIGAPNTGATFDNFLVTTSGGTPTPITAVTTLQGQGSLNATANIVNPANLTATASFRGQGSLTASANLISPVVASASFQGQGSLTATANQVLLASASLQGQGTLSANGVVTITASSSFQGSSSLSATGQVLATNVAGQANFYGVSSLVSNPQVSQAPVLGVANFSGQSSLSASASISTTGSASFQGSGFLMANAVLPAGVSVNKTWNAVFDPNKSWTGVFTLTKKQWTAVFDPKKVWVGGED